MSEHSQPKAVQSQRFMNLSERFGDARSAKPAAGEILILCTRTKTPVATGLRIEWVVFKSLPPVAVPLLCPVCGLTHRWKPDEAWIGTNA
jgi:hypothetical protein